MKGKKNLIKNRIDFEDVLAVALNTPGVKINRESFSKAGISKDTINKISKHVINYETTKVTGLSVVASIPGGPAAVGAAAADITSYFVFILRVVQELAYLYGFDEFELKDNSVDSETKAYLLLFMGAMFGVKGATKALNKFANIYAKHVAKNLAKKALTKGTLYPIVKKIAYKVGVHMTKQLFADTVASAIPLVGGAISGGLTFVMFKPNCMKLRKHLMSYNLCDPDFYRSDDTEEESFESDEISNINTV